MYNPDQVNRATRDTISNPALLQTVSFGFPRKAYRKVSNDVTDDASLVEQLGYKVKLYMGSYDNIKVTTASDLAIADVLVRRYG